MNKCKDCDKIHENNTGCWNSGNMNSGNMNSGNMNSGNMNSGDWNSGNWNSGNWNSGDWNSGNWNSGHFNTDEPDKIRVFNQWLDMTHSEFLEKYNIYANIPLNHWIEKEKMSSEEKQSVKGWEQMGGYLKTLEFKDACVIWWKENPNEHARFINLPNFSWKIFTEITGIESDKLPEKCKDEIVINGVRYKKVEL